MSEVVSFLSPNCVEHTALGQERRFYPARLGMVVKLRALAHPLIESLSVLFMGGGADVGGTQQRVLSNADGSTASEKMVDATKDYALKLKAERHDAAIKKLVEALTDPKTVTVLGELAMDSLRDEYPLPHLAPAVAAFTAQLDTVGLAALLAGIGKANAQVFGPFEGKLTEAAKALGEKMGTLTSITS